MAPSPTHPRWQLAKVFLSYAHESDEHKAQVLAFATFLRHAGIAAVLDLWTANARQDWYAWAIREMTDANFILVVASQRYRMMGDVQADTITGDINL